MISGGNTGFNAKNVVNRDSFNVVEEDGTNDGNILLRVKDGEKANTYDNMMIYVRSKNYEDIIVTVKISTMKNKGKLILKEDIAEEYLTNNRMVRQLILWKIRIIGIILQQLME